MIQLEGQRFGRLTVLSRSINNTHRHSRWLCLCECGTEKIVAIGHLRTGGVKSCGCLRREVVTNTKTKHGGAYSSEYTSWAGMFQRCTNPKNQDYADYGGRGIQVWKAWKDFRNFLKDVGPKPSPKLSLDRINNEGNYEPGNVRWATQAQQVRNSRKRRRKSSSNLI